MFSLDEMNLELLSPTGRKKRKDALSSEESRARRKESQARYVAAHPEMRRATVRKSRAKHSVLRNAADRARRLKNIDHCRRRDRDHRAANLEHYRAYRYERRQANIERERIKEREWAKRGDHEKKLESTRRWRDANKEHRRRYDAEYLRRYPEKNRMAAHKRRARILGATVGDPKHIEAWERRWKNKVRVRCYWCQKSVNPRTAVQDHIQAISKGGTHSIENLCISCFGCNARKYNFTTEVWNKRVQQPVLL